MYSGQSHCEQISLLNRQCDCMKWMYRNPSKRTSVLADQFPNKLELGYISIWCLNSVSLLLIGDGGHMYTWYVQLQLGSCLIDHGRIHS